MGQDFGEGALGQRSANRWILCGLVGFASVGWWWWSGGLREGWWEKVFLFSLLGLAMFSAFFWSGKGGKNRGRWILWLGILARALLLPAEPSDDVNRYLWEGKLLREGISPYGQVADATELEHLRDAHWEEMNHRDRFTIYPPGALGFFSMVGAIWYSPMALKLVFLVFDLILMGLLIRELPRRGLDGRYLAFYALNPAVLLATAGEAHFDILFLLPLFLAIRSFEKNREVGGWAWLGLAVQMKWIPLLLVPWLLCRRKGCLRGWAVFGAIVLVPGLPFLGDVSRVVKGTLEFGGGSHFNGSLHALVLSILGDGGTTWVTLVSGGGLLVTLILTGILVRSPYRYALAALGALLLWSSVVHFWYLSWLAPFLVLIPRFGWLLVSVSMCFYFLSWQGAAEGDGWGIEPWAQVLIWLPAWVFFSGDFLRGIRRLLNRSSGAWGRAIEAGSDKKGEAEVFGVIIPSYQEADKLEALVQSFEGEGTGAPFILALAAEDEASIELAQQRDWAFSVASVGRGTQIAAAYEQIDWDVVVIRHSDVRDPGGEAFRALVKLCQSDQELVGGICGQQFSGEANGYLEAVEWMNTARFLITEIGFGDQMQFFRRRALEKSGGFPALRLMEDVELSLRLKEQGPVACVGVPVESDPRAWLQTRFWKRVGLILKLTLNYRWDRFQGKEISGYYERYYGRDRN